MSTHDEHEPRDDASRLPPKTTPTFEIELLISGVTVFALLQVPGALDDWSDRISTTQNDALMLLAMLGAIYVKAAAITLALTFVLHLALRAYWIALVGLRSVYPEGIRWDAIDRFAPHSMRLAREKLGSLDELVESADNRASLVFANGVGFAFGMLIPVIFVSAIAFSSFLVAVATGMRDQWALVFGAISVLGFVPFLVVVLVDRYAGHRIDPASRTGRALRAVLNAYESLGMGRRSNPLLLISTSHVGRRRAQVLSTVVVTLIMGAVVAHSLMRLQVWQLDALDYLPAPGAATGRTLDPRQYASSRGRDLASAAVPYIQSEVVRGDYVRLFVPFRSRRHTQALRSGCPGVAPDPLDDAAAEAQRLDALAACLARIHVATLDGTPLPPLDFVFATDLQTGVRGMVAQIRVADLADGRHVLEVARVPRAPPLQEPEGPFVIPFWR